MHRGFFVGWQGIGLHGKIDRKIGPVRGVRRLTFLSGGGDPVYFFRIFYGRFNLYYAN
jgi:hypothetical protein